MFAAKNVGAPTVSRGESVYVVPGTYTWVCPAGVTSVSVVCVGAGGRSSGSNYTPGSGGALAWANDISVTPGTSYSIVVGRSAVSAGTAGDSSAFGRTAGGGRSMFAGQTVLGGVPSGTVGTSRGGGTGGGISDPSINGGLGGGGAGGYAGNGGNASPRDSEGNPQSGLSGSGGGGGGAGSSGGGGGGVGLFGQGTSGAGSSSGGFGGSGGGRGQDSGDSNGMQTFGGGATSGNTALGGNGAVRIVWPGTTRQFPSTDVGTP